MKVVVGEEESGAMRFVETVYSGRYMLEHGGATMAVAAAAVGYDDDIFLGRGLGDV